MCVFESTWEHHVYNNYGLERPPPTNKQKKRKNRQNLLSLLGHDWEGWGEESLGDPPRSLDGLVRYAADGVATAVEENVGGGAGGGGDHVLVQDDSHRAVIAPQPARVP